MDLTMRDIDLFYSWFDIFYGIMDDMFFLGESCLYAWIERTCSECLTRQQRKWGTEPDKLTGPLSEARRLKYKRDILRLPNNVRLCKETFAGKPVLQTLPEMAHDMELFVSHLLAYLDLKASILPQCISQRYNINDRSRYERHYWSSAQKKKYASNSVYGCCYHCMDESSQAAPLEVQVLPGQGQTGVRKVQGGV